MAASTVPAAAGEAGGDAVAAAHRQLTTDGITQFGLPAYVPKPPPDWIGQLLDWLARSGPLLRTCFWIGLILIGLLILWGVAPPLWRLLRRLTGREPAAAVDEGWRPDAAPARALLAEADALAADGKFAEAAHLVLLRSVEQIATHRPGELRPALTSRDIAVAKALPRDVAQAFAAIAAVVEEGLFASRPVSGDAWTRCRKAYEGVAFPKAWA